MSNAESSVDAALSERLQTLEKQVDALRAAIVNARRLRLMILFIGVALICVVIFLFLGLARRVSSKEFLADVTKEAQSQLENNQDRYVGEIKGLVDDAAPIVSKAFYEQTKQDMQKYSVALNEQRDIFAENIQAALEDRVNKQYSKVLADHEAILTREFPALSDKETRDKIVAGFELAMHQLIQRYYANEFESTLNEVYSAWDEFPAADEPGENEERLEDQFVRQFLDILTLTLAQLHQSRVVSASEPIDSESSRQANQANDDNDNGDANDDTGDNSTSDDTSGDDNSAGDDKTSGDDDAGAGDSTGGDGSDDAGSGDSGSGDGDSGDGDSGDGDSGDGDSGDGDSGDGDSGDGDSGDQTSES